MTSIRHFPATYPLPDWRNFGVILRVLLGVNVLTLIGALVQAPGIDQWLPRFIEMTALVEPLLLLLLGLLAGLRDVLRRLPLRLGQLAVLLLVMALAMGQQIYWQSLGFPEGGSMLRVVLLACVTCGLLLLYFELRARAFSLSSCCRVTAASAKPFVGIGQSRATAAMAVLLRGIRIFWIGAVKGAVKGSNIGC